MRVPFVIAVGGFNYVPSPLHPDSPGFAVCCNERIALGWSEGANTMAFAPGPAYRWKTGR
jgi:hypothetical protein